MKSIWTGTISFGLVNIPVDLFSAIQYHTFGFTLLHKKCKTPIRNKRWCDKCNQEVMWEDTVKGLKIDKNTYVILTKEQIDRIKAAKTEIIQIVEFVDYELIAPIYFDKHYYVVPGKGPDKAFFLFSQALDDSGKIAIGSFVMREKEYVVAIQPYSDVLLLTTLNYAYEIRDVKQLIDWDRAPAIKAQELKLAQKIIDQLTVDEFDISQFKDTYVTRLKALLKKAKTAKVPIEEVVPKPKRKRKEPENLMDALRASLGDRPERRPAASARTKARAKAR